MKSYFKTVPNFSSERYQITKLLGSGGMGEVFLATDRNLDSQVVIKIPHASMLQDAEFAARFQLEIRSLVRLRHRSIVSIMDVGDENGVPFAVMQYLEGGSLEDQLRNGPMSEATLQQWLPDVASALDFIHREGFVHRDIKPANILFDREGNAYVSDFGVAKVIDKGAAKQKAAATMTGTGMVMGTPDYMAPELVMGERFDHRADQYALAVTVYEILSGRRPFEGPTSAAVMVKHSTMPAPSLKNGCPSASLHAVSAVERALSKLASSRYDSCTEFCSAVLNQSLVTTPPTGSSVRSSATRTVQSQGLSCPSCGTTMRLGQQHAGKSIRCSGCQVTLKVADNLSGLTRTTVGSGASASNPTKKSDKQTASTPRPPAASLSATRQQLPVAPNAAVETVQAIRQTESHTTSRRQRIISSVVVGMLILVAGSAAIQFRRNGVEISSVSSSAEDSGVAGENAIDGEAAKLSAEITFSPIPAMTIPEETALSFTAKVTGTLTGTERFHLASGYPSGMSIESDTGRIRWIPAEADGPGEFTATVQITDSTQREIVSACEFSIRVEEVNKPPVFLPVPPHSVKPGETIKFPVVVRDTDIPANPFKFSVRNQGMHDISINEHTGEISATAPKENVGSEIPITVVAEDSHGSASSMNIIITIDNGIRASMTDKPPVTKEDKAPQYFVKNTNLIGNRISGSTAEGYTLHVGKYLGSGRFDATLIHQSTGTLASNKKQFSSAYSVGAEYKSFLTYNATANTVRIEAVSLIRNPSVYKVNLGFTIKGKLSDETFTMPEFEWRPYDQVAAMMPADQILQVGRQLKFEEIRDKRYFGRIVISRIANGTFEGTIIYDGWGAGGNVVDFPAWVTHGIGGRFNEDGTVGIIYGNMLSKSPTAIANSMKGQTNVLRHNNGILVGINLEISQ